MTWWKQVAELDHDAMRKLKEIGYPNREAWVLTFDEFLNGSFPNLMRKILHELEQAYAYPVDTEFTVNFAADGRMQINLLQCRPLQTNRSESSSAHRLSLNKDNVLFSTYRNSMGGNIQQKLDRVIYIQPEAYADLTINDKYQVARLIGRLNRIFKDRNIHPFILIGPGRWGSSTPSLGVPVSFAEICNASVLVEAAESKGGYMPELSFGTHFFQDLVETRIFYTAIFPGQEDVVFNAKLLDNHKNCFVDLLPDYAKWQSVIKVMEYINESKELWIESDMQTQQTVCFLTALG
jgi:hypothetical protein